MCICVVETVNRYTLICVQRVASVQCLFHDSCTQSFDDFYISIGASLFATYYTINKSGLVNTHMRRQRRRRWGCIIFTFLTNSKRVKAPDVQKSTFGESQLGPSTLWTSMVRHSYI